MEQPQNGNGIDDFSGANNKENIHGANMSNAA
jgi:hypothetical protein